jgi:hypothetical protein
VRLVLVACVLDAVNGCVFLAGGVTLFAISSRVLSQSFDPNDYGAGMLIGGVALVASIAAAVCGLHGYWCWRRSRRDDTRSAGLLQTLFVVSVPAVTTLVTGWLVLRLFA